MFYLKEFFKSLGESIFRGFFFFMFSCLLAFGLTHRSWIAKNIEKVTPEKIVRPYFVAVVDGSVDANKVREVISHLPGVMGIDDKDSTRGKEKLADLVAQLGDDYKLNEEFMNFRSLRIILSPALSAESLDFIREQVVKMGGKDHVTATDVKYPEVTAIMNSHPFYAFLGRAGDWGVIGILAALWIASYWLSYDIFRSRSYIIEKFQRKKFVAAKTLATGFGIIITTFAGLGVWNGTLKFFDLILLFAVFSVFWTFSMQEWRWKPTL